MTKLIWLLCLSAALTADPVDMRAKLLVKGGATWEIEPDQLALSLGVVTQADTAESALQANNQKMTSVIAALEKAGLTKDDYKTGRFSIQPVWSRPPHNPDHTPDADWKPSIVGYSVTNTLSVKTPKLNLAAEILDSAGKAGANTIDNVAFGLKEPEQHRSEVIAKAAANAMGQARDLAKATHQRLVRLLEVTLDEGRVGLNLPRAGLFMAKSGGNGDELPINPGKIEVSANVSLVYEIAP